MGHASGPERVEARITSKDIPVPRAAPTAKNHLAFSSVQFSRSVVSDSLWPHESQHVKPPCPSTPGAYSNSCPSSQWCHPAISSSVVPVFSCPQSLPVSGSFPKSQLFAWGGQSTGVSAPFSRTILIATNWEPFTYYNWIVTNLHLSNSWLSWTSHYVRFLLSKSIYSVK